jgi:hypothetical protein
MGTVFEVQYCVRKKRCLSALLRIRQSRMSVVTGSVIELLVSGRVDKGPPGRWWLGCGPEVQLSRSEPLDDQHGGGAHGAA